jgi:hypothetical protein
MKNTHARQSELEAILREETEILALMNACQKRMYESVLVRDWVMLQNETALFDTISESFLEAERKRLYIVHSIKPDAGGSKDFYAVTAPFAEASRTRINGLYREVKRLLLLSKTENDVLNSYVTNARAVASGVIETMLPARRNKIYNRRGSLASTPVESMVLNRSF